MSVEVVKNNGKIYVNAKPDNAPKGSAGAAGVSVECKNEVEAKVLAEEMKKAEAKIKEQIAQAGPVNLNEGAKKAGEGENLDIKAA